jgi:hypothetical protein
MIHHSKLYFLFFDIHFYEDERNTINIVSVRDIMGKLNTS